MRFLEVILAFALGGRIILHRRLPRWVKFLPIPLAILQVLLEGYRWQLLPIYFLTIGTGIQALRNLDPWRGQPPRRAVILGFALSAPALAIAIALPVLLPIPMPPPPTGPFAVGTMVLHLVDQSRVDPYAPEPDARREILVQVWYPAVPAGGEVRAPWMDRADLVAPAVASWVDLPEFAFDHLVFARTSSLEGAAVAPGERPLLLFSHGFGGFRAQNTFQMQELASYGYVVAAVEHTYAAVVTVFPDGRVAEHNPATLPDGLSDEAYEAAAEALVRQWVADLRFTVDSLTRGNNDPGDPFFGSLDLGRIGALGHSTGGGAIVQFCNTDERCGAALGMDAWLLPVEDAVLADGALIPSLHLYSEGWMAGPNSRRMAAFAAASPDLVDSYWIEGTQHYDFSDLPAVSPLAAALNLKGPIDGALVQRIVNELSVAFFDNVLKSGGIGLPPDMAGRYPEVEPLHDPR